GSTNDSITVNPLVTTIYSVTVNNSFNCPSNDTITLTVIPPGIPLAGPDAFVCIGDSIQLHATELNAQTLQWSTLGDGHFSSINTLPDAWYVPGDTDTTAGFVILVVQTTGACLNLTDTLLLSINHYPTVDAGPDTTITAGPGTGAVVPTHATITN